MITLSQQKRGFIMAFTMGLSDSERFRAAGYIQAFIAAMPRYHQDGDQITYLEAFDDTRPLKQSPATIR